MKKYILLFKDTLHNKIDFEEFDDFRLANKKYLKWKNVLSGFSYIRVYLVCNLDVK